MINTSRIKVATIILVLLFVILFSSGCWDSLDINEKSIVTAVVLDYDEDNIIFYIEIANPEKTSSDNGGQGHNTYLIYKGMGKDFVEARNCLDEKLQKPIYISATRTIIMTERFTQLYLIEYLHRFRADATYRKKIDTIIIRDEPEELIKIMQDKNESLGFKTEEIILNLRDMGRTFEITTMDLLESISSEYTSALLPCMGISEEEVALIGYSVLKDDKVDGFLPIEEIEGMLFLKADKPVLDYRMPYKDMCVTLEITQKNRKTKAHYDNEQITMNINMEFRADLLFGDKKEPYDFQQRDERILGQMLKERLTEEISEAVIRSQTEFNSDYYEFSEEFRIKYPIEFDGMDWNEEYPNIKFNYNIKVKLGTTWVMDYSNDDTK